MFRNMSDDALRLPAMTVFSDDDQCRVDILGNLCNHCRGLAGISDDFNPISKIASLLLDLFKLGAGCIRFSDGAA
jgi:hypothetical protein